MKPFNFIVVSVLSALLSPLHVYSQSAKAYEKAYQEEYQEAVEYIKGNRFVILETLKGFQTDPNILMAIVFPEIVRFSGVQNMMETASLEILYTRYGAGYANFSIGRFQMKPSFIEELESYAVQYKLAHVTSQIRYDEQKEKDIRAERIRRLKKIKWQLLYLAIFEQIVEHKFAISWNNLEHKITFLASAYNLGFNHTKSQIESWIGEKAFPYGSGYKGPQYAYTDIAYDAYLRCLPQILR